MKHDFSFSDSFLNLDQTKLHPRSQLDQSHRPLLPLHSSPSIPPSNIISRESNFPSSFVFLRSGRMTRLRSSVRLIRLFRVGSDESHSFMTEDVVGDIFRATEVEDTFSSSAYASRIPIRSLFVRRSDRHASLPLPIHR